MGDGWCNGHTYLGVNFFVRRVILVKPQSLFQQLQLQQLLPIRCQSSLMEHKRTSRTF